MSGLGEQSLASLLENVAAATPAPGGGTSAALALALGAGLVEMSALLAGEEAAAARAGELRARGLELAERELTSYAPVLEAMRLPGEDPGREERVAEALVEASRSPLAIAEAAAEVASLGVEVARASKPNVRGDALAGTTIAEAAAAAAARLVEINLAQQSSAPELERAREAAAKASKARAEATSSRRPSG